MVGPVAALAVVLALAGLAKLRRPAPTAASLAVLHVPGAALTARVIGLGEVAIAVTALTVGGRWPAALLAAAFAALAAVAARLVAEGDGRDCGCFGPVRSPATHWHTAVDAAAALAAVAAAIVGVPSLREVATGDALRAVPLLTLVGVLAALLVLCLTALPDLLRLTEATS